MIFIANNTREIEKNNLNLKMKISKISENLKINKIELAAHQNSSYSVSYTHLTLPTSDLV